MARYTEAVCRQCRREGAKLYLKGDKCYSDKCAFSRRGYAPGQHGQGRKKVSEYGTQLREKQKARRIYGLLEGQFRSYFEKAELKIICPAFLYLIFYKTYFAISTKYFNVLIN